MIVESLADPQPERAKLALDVLLARGWQPATVDEKLDWFSAQSRRQDLRGKATLIFIAHHLPDNLKVDRVLRIGGGAGHANSSISVVAPARDA